MHHQRAIACLLVSTLVLGAAQAQPASGPTDRQLATANCLGRQQEALAWESSIWTPAPPRSLDSIIADLKAKDEAENGPLERRMAAQYGSMAPTVIKAHNEGLAFSAKIIHDGEENMWSMHQNRDRDRQRLLSYLVATGALEPTNPQTVQGVDIARNRGVADAKQCKLAADDRCQDQWKRISSVSDLPQGEKERHEVVQAWLDCKMSIPACAGEKRCAELLSELPF
jgi:hypothetical protein